MAHKLYKLSKNYERLYELIKSEYVVICFCGEENLLYEAYIGEQYEGFSDKHRSVLIIEGQGHMLIQAVEKESFIKSCKNEKVSYIKPNKPNVVIHNKAVNHEFH